MLLRQKAGLPFILATVFLDMLGIGIVIPVLPALVSSMTADKPAQAYWYGALLASYGVAQFLFAPFLGAVSDRFGRRSVLLISIFGLALNFFITAVSPWLWLLLVSRLIGGGFGASYTIAGAYIADVTKPENRSRSFGLMGAVFGLGFICGPMIGGLLAANNLRLPYFVAAGLALLNWLNGYFILPESLPKERRTPIDFKKVNPFSAILALTQVRGIGSLVMVYTFSVFGQFILQANWVLYTSFRFGWGPKENGISLFVVGIVSTVVQAGLFGILLKKLGDTRTALAGMASSAISYVFYGLAFQGWMMYAIILVNLLGFVINPALQGIVSKAVDPRHQGITLGSLNSISSIMMVIAPLVGTPLLAHVSGLPATDWRVGMVFFVAALAQGTAFVQAYFHFRRKGVGVSVTEAA
jgi:DHA1 family tetracycline resistance protein-like MFS transporter